MDTIRTARAVGVCVALLAGNWVGLRAAAEGSGSPPSPAPKPARQMAGRVLDADGRAVEGAEIYLFAREATDKPERRLRAAKTPADGKYRFENLSDRAYIVAVNAPGFARAYRLVSLSDGDRPAADIAVRRPGNLSVVVRTANGKPLAGARVWDVWQQDANGSFFFENRVFDDPAFNLEIPPSDASGRIPLPFLPLGAVISLRVEHPDFVQFYQRDVSVKPQTTVEAVMRSGVTLTLRLDSPELAKLASPLKLRLFRVPFGDPSTYTDYLLSSSFGQRGRCA